MAAGNQESAAQAIKDIRAMVESLPLVVEQKTKIALNEIKNIISAVDREGVAYELSTVDPDTFDLVAEALHQTPVPIPESKIQYIEVGKKNNRNIILTSDGKLHLKKVN